MAYTFFKAKGIPIGTSLCEDEFIDKAKEIIQLCHNKYVKLILPVDNVAVESFESPNPPQITSSEIIPEGLMGVDIDQNLKAI